MRKVWDSVVLGGLTLVTGVLAGVLVWNGTSTPLEGFAFVTGAVCVWLTVKESTWNFPISLINVAAFFVVFLRAHLFGDMSLQVVYFVLTAMGWYLWLRGGERRTALRITEVDPISHAGVIVAATLLTFILWGVLHAINGSVTLWDALTTAISLGAQWLLNYKKLENWWWWILADVIYIPLYAWKGLYLTSLLYGAFLVMATMGYLQWRRTMRERRGRGFDVLLTESTA
jgi:nicotinamide mononucleotide transporter